MSIIPTLQIKIDGETHKIKCDKLRDESYRAELGEKVQAAEGQVQVSLKSLANWEPKDQIDAISFCYEYEADLRFHIGKDSQSEADLFEAVIACLVTNNEMEKHQGSVAAALLVAALKYPDALPGACDRIVQRLRSLGQTGVDRRNLLKQANEFVREIDEIKGSNTSETDSLTIHEIFDDAPVSSDIKVPNDWQLTQKGIGRIGQKQNIPTPILISSRQRDINYGTELVTLAWWSDGRWNERVVNRAAIASTRLIVEELAPYGVIVTSNNAKELVQYLADFASCNQATLETTSVSRQLGWQGLDGIDGFLLSEALLTPDTSFPNNLDTKNQKIHFHGSDEGDNQIADAFHCKGEFEKWMQVLEKVKDFPQVMLTIFACLTAPLLQIFQSPNFIVSLAGRTSGGKTTALRIGASCWGNPNEQDSSSVLKTWSGTATWRERVPANLNNLPFILDDTKHALKGDDVAKTIYGVAQGVGKGRGSTKGLAKQNTWKTVAIMSGEQPATSFTDDGGTRSRTLSLWGSPFKETDPKTGNLVRQIDSRVREHFGHAGPRLVQYLLHNRDLWPEWRKEYKDELKKFQTWAEEENNPFAGRMAPHFAAIATTAWITHSALELPWDYTDPIEPIWDQVAKEAGEANRAAAALRHVMDWAFAHQQEFYLESGSETPVSGNGWAGRWEPKKPSPITKKNDSDWAWIGFIPARLREILRSGGFEDDSTIRSWKDEGWLVLDKSADSKDRCTKKSRVGKNKTPINLIAISCAAFKIIS